MRFGMEQKQKKNFPRKLLIKKYIPTDSDQKKHMSKEEKNIATLHVQKNLASLKIPITFLMVHPLCNRR